MTNLPPRGRTVRFSDTEPTRQPLRRQSSVSLFNLPPQQPLRRQSSLPDMTSRSQQPPLRRQSSLSGMNLNPQRSTATSSSMQPQTPLARQHDAHSPKPVEFTVAGYSIQEENAKLYIFFKTSHRLDFFFTFDPRKMLNVDALSNYMLMFNTLRNGGEPDVLHFEEIHVWLISCCRPLIEALVKEQSPWQGDWVYLDEILSVPIVRCITGDPGDTYGPEVAEAKADGLPTFTISPNNPKTATIEYLPRPQSVKDLNVHVISSGR